MERNGILSVCFGYNLDWAGEVVRWWLMERNGILSVCFGYNLVDKGKKLCTKSKPNPPFHIHYINQLALFTISLQVCKVFKGI